MIKYNCKSLLVVFFVLGAFCETIAQHANAGDDKAICPSQSVEIGTDTDPSWCYFWEDDKGNNSYPNTPKITVNPSETTTYTVTVTGPDFEFKDDDDVKVAVIKDIKIKEVSFSGNVDVVKDNGSGSYTAPHWKDGSPPSPVCYKGGDVMQLTAKIELDEDPGASAKVKVKGTSTNGFDINETSVPSGKTLNLPSTSISKALSNQVDFYDPFEIEWEVSFDDGANWCAAGKSTNKLYVTWRAPAGGVTLFHTVVGLSCRNARGQSAESAIFNGVWSEFTDRNVTTIDPPVRRLTYYANWQNSNVTTAALLRNGDGQCGSWAKLLLDMLKVQGITLAAPYVFIQSQDDPANGGFFVKNCTFTGAGTSGNAAYPYFNIGDSPLVLATSYNWQFAEVNDAAGIAGQGTANPAALFNNHQFIRYNGRFYDPSYGTENASIADVDTNSIDAYFTVGPVRVSEAALNIDLDGDGRKNGVFTINTLIFNKNPAGNNLTVQYLSY